MGYTKIGGGGSSAYASFTPIVDVGIGDSNKTVDLSATRETIVQMVRVVVTTTSTATNRQIVVEMRDSANTVLAEARAGTVQAPSTGPFVYEFGINLPRLSAFVDTNYTTCTLPQVNLPADCNLHVFDKNEVGSSVDLMKIYVTGVEKV